MPYIAAGVTVFLWASEFPAVKFALCYYSPGSLMLFRFFVAFAFLAVYCGIKKTPLPKKTDLPSFFILGFVGIFLYMLVFNIGAKMIPSGITSFINASTPVFTLILSVVFLKEKAAPTTWLGVLVSLAGIVVISIAEVNELQLNVGVWLIILASVFSAVYSIIQKYLLKKYTAMQATFLPVGFGTVFMLIFLPELIREFPAAPMYANITVIYLGVLPAAIAYWLWGYALAKSEKTIYITKFLYLMPFIASLIAFFWLGEIISAIAVIGGGIVIAGMFITNAKGTGVTDKAE